MKNFGLVFVVVLSLKFNLFAQWHWQNPTPIGKPIYDMTFTDSLNGYICGYGGLILKTTDAGLHWKEIEVPTKGLIFRIFFINKDVGWYLSYEDMTLYKSSDAGESWEVVSSFSPKYATTICFIDEMNGFAGGYYNLLRTTDGGKTWIEDTNVGNAYSLQFLNQNIGFATTHNGIYTTTNGGNSWLFKGIPAFDFAPSKVFAYDQNNIFVIGTDGWINGELYYVFYQSSNSGNSWIGKQFNNQITDVFFESPTSGWVCSDKIYHSINRGINWDSTNTYAQQFEFKGANSWAAGVNTISYSNDRWQTVTPQIKGVFSGFLWDGCAKDTNTAFACGSNKTIIGTTDGGKIWNKYYSSSDNYYLNGITFKGDEVWAVGQHGVVVSSKDYGVTWNEKTIIDGNWLSDITFISNGVGYIVGMYAGGGIFTSLDQGETWNVMENYPDLWSIDKIKFSRDDLGWALGYPYALMRSTTNGRSWEIVVDSIYNFSNIAVSGDTAWFTYYNNVLRTTDAGISWESFKVFDYNTMILSNCDIDFIDSKTGYVSTYDSRVYKSIDGGETWVEETFPNGLSSFAMDFVNEEIGWVFGYPGIVLKRDPDFVSVDNLGYGKSYPNKFTLYQNYPNPFNPTTKITWQSPSAGHQTIKVYDVLGNEVITLVDEYRNAGIYEVGFDASKLSSGVYFYQLKAGDFISTKKMILMR